jgi:predicted nucleic acid-binding protein
MIAEPRQAAELVGVSTLTVGLLIRARKDYFIPPLKPILELLSASGYFLSASLIDHALREVAELSK